MMQTIKNRPLNKSIMKRLFSNINTVQGSQTIDRKEVDQFRQHKNDWWNETGPFHPLHSMNALRVPFVRDGLFNCGAISKSLLNTSRPLQNVKILDVGCGGGILSEPLARLGANVTGIDATKELIEVAKDHAKKDLNLKQLTYLHESVEEHVKNNVEKYDAIVSSEVVEHVTHKDIFLDHVVNCLKPNGSIFITTVNRTWLAQLLVIFVAENVLNLVPPGTHQYDKFITPHALQRMLEMYNCRTRLIHGMLYNPLTQNWYWSSDTSTNYVLHAIKNKN